ncbi:phosphatase PAP2 family protein [Phenylobacterium sp.]|uniref:phosphatase PAP2 family protein n=1 Tax=Phenylobacterium sp. TaxID=1871053 RepID=UPI003782F44E
MFRRLTLAVTFAGVALCAAADAQTPAPPGYLPKAAVDGQAILPAPATPDSPQGKADRAFYDESRKLKDTPRWAAAIQDDDLWKGGVMRRFSCALGAEIGETSTPATFRMLRRVGVDLSAVGNGPKAHYARTRPLIGNDQPICIAREDWMKTNFSYPSGHAMIGWGWGLILTELAPARATPLLVAGREMGESRAICGAHFASDVEAARTLAAGVVARLHAEPQFLSDMATARAELAGAKPARCG